MIHSASELSSITRVIPKDMQQQSTKPASVEASAIEDKLKVTSRVENVNEGYCPICGNQLQPTEANGNTVLFCANHNIVMPCRDH